MSKNIISQEYSQLPSDLKVRVTSARYKAALSVNKELILLYHHIGTAILHAQESQGWGTKVICQLSKDLRSEFSEMKGFSPQNLKYMRKFSETYNLDEIGQQAVDQLPWGHIVTLIFVQAPRKCYHKFSRDITSTSIRSSSCNFTKSVSL